MSATPIPIKLPANPYLQRQDKRGKQEARKAATVQQRRYDRLEEEAARELDGAVQATIAARQKRLAQAEARIVQATKLMERECQSERVKTKRLEPELEKLVTANSKLFRSISAARDSLLSLPSTPFSISTLLPTENEAISLQRHKLAVGESQLEEVQASVLESERARKQLEAELTKLHRGSALVGLGRTRIKVQLGELHERAAGARERALQPDANAAARTKLRDEKAATKISKERLEEILIDVDSRQDQIVTPKAQLDDGKESQVELAKLRVALVTASEAVADAKSSIEPPQAPDHSPAGPSASTHVHLEGSSTAAPSQITDLESHIRDLIEEKEHARRKRVMATLEPDSSSDIPGGWTFSERATPVDGDRRADQRRDVERLVETVAKLNARMVELREENLKLLMRLVGAE